MKVLIAYDGSPVVGEAGAMVADLAWAGLPAGTRAVVLSVFDTPAWEAVGAVGGPAAVAAAGLAPLDFSGARAHQLVVAERGAGLVREAFPSWTVTAEAGLGRPAWEIIQRAEGRGSEGGGAGSDAGPFDLVIVGSRGHSGLRRLLLGSVAHRVVSASSVPVRVARGRENGGVAPRESTRGARIVVGVDGSPDAQAAVEAVAARAWPIGTQVLVASFETGPITMISRWEPGSIWGSMGGGAGAAGADGRPAQRVAAEAAAFLQRAQPDLTVRTLVRAMDPKHGLIAAAEDWEGGRGGGGGGVGGGADCIFVGASGGGGDGEKGRLARFLVGSVSMSVALNAPCSVEVVRRARPDQSNA